MSGTSIATALAPIFAASAETSAAAMSGDSANNGPTREVVAAGAHDGEARELAVAQGHHAPRARAA